MLKPTLPIDETQRLLSLHSLRILDTPSEACCQRLDKTSASRLRQVRISTSPL